MNTTHFPGFSVLAPPNSTVMFALIVSAVAVSGAIFLISSEPMLNALHEFAK